jgi:hypothetical protein
MNYEQLTYFENHIILTGWVPHKEPPSHNTSGIMQCVSVSNVLCQSTGLLQYSEVAGITGIYTQTPVVRAMPLWPGSDRHSPQADLAGAYPAFVIGGGPRLFYPSYANVYTRIQNEYVLQCMSIPSWQFLEFDLVTITLTREHLPIRKFRIRPCNNFTTILLDYTVNKVCEASAGGKIDWIAGQNMAT